MEYYGDLNKKRLMIVADYKLKDIADPTSEIGYIFSKGLLLDYTLKQFTEGYIHNNKQGDIHPCENNKPWVIYSDCWSVSKANKRKLLQETVSAEQKHIILNDEQSSLKIHEYMTMSDQ